MKAKKKYLGKEKKQQILANLTHNLSQEAAIMFAYIHGSFLNSRVFHDLDVAVYVDENRLLTNEDLFQLELHLAAKIDLSLPGITVDLRLLNAAPLNFRFRIVNRGSLLFSKDERKRIEFVAKIRDFFFDFEPHRRLLYQVLVLGKKDV